MRDFFPYKAIHTLLVSACWGAAVVLALILPVSSLVSLLLLTGIMLLWAWWMDHPSRAPTIKRTVLHDPHTKKKKKRGGLLTMDEDAVYRVQGKGWSTTWIVDLDAGVYHLRYWFPSDIPVSVKLLNLYNQACIPLVTDAVGTNTVLFEIDASRYRFAIRPAVWTRLDFHWRLEFEQVE